MVAQNIYSDPTIASTLIQQGFPAPTLIGLGGVPKMAVATITVGATDLNGSIYRAFANVPGTIVITSLRVSNTAITSGTSYSLGIYGTNYGAALVNPASTNLGNLFMSAVSLASANSFFAPIDGLQALTLAQRLSLDPLWLLAGYTIAPLPNRFQACDICLLANTIGSSGGTVGIQMEYLNA
jgi:hypothetical protein